MKERPILFTPENIRKIRAGEKWQTRRIIEPQPEERADGWHVETKPRSGYSAENTMRSLLPVYCPFGKEGDRLWVRESLYEEGGQWLYRLDSAPVLIDKAYESEAISWAHHKSTSRASAIHMPRFAARLWLNVTEVRVERLQDISEEDAKAEGVHVAHGHMWRPLGSKEPMQPYTHRQAFSALWDTINGAEYPWSSNPWVWCISFVREP